MHPMSFRRFRLRYFLLPIVSLSFLGYFAHHTLNGARGLVAYKQLQDRAGALEVKIAALKVKRRKLESQVSLLHRESLDPDMLDERARIILNLAKPNEITILRQAR